MGGMWIVQIIVLVCVAICIVGLLAKALRYARMPLHLRWELYPVPHEEGRAHGGSYLERSDYWQRPGKTSRVAEIVDMASEILLIKTLWRHNRRQWFFSFPFHIGLYALVVFVILLLVGAAFQIAGEYVYPYGWTWLRVLYYATIVFGVGGLILSTIGALGLLYRRLTDPKLRDYSETSDYLNLVFILAALISALVAWAWLDLGFVYLRVFLRGVLTFTEVRTYDVIVVEVVIGALFLAYLPFTQMTHFVAKYFTWHGVRWDDSPNLGQEGMTRRIKANLGRPVGWSAPHVDGSKSWAEVAKGEEK